MKRALLTDDEVCSKYKHGEKIKSLQHEAGISRTAIYDILKRGGVDKTRREVLVLTCKFCDEVYNKPKSHIKGKNAGYCSVQCFHADRSISGEYSKSGGCISRVNQSLRDVAPCTDRVLGRLAAKALLSAGIVLNTGEVVHHIDGDRRNFNIDNLRVFKNQSEHMKFHHSLRHVQKI